MADKVVVYVVDEDDGVRRDLCRLLDSAGLHAEPFASADAFSLACPLPVQPSCLVLDLHLRNGLSGLDLQAQLGDRQQTLPIIFITGVGTVQASVRAMKAGAFDVLQKPIDDMALLESVRGALALSRDNALAQTKQTLVERRVMALTRREREVLWLVVHGLSNRQIAAELGTAEKTVEVHRGRITRELQAGSVAELVEMTQRLSIDQVRRWLGDDAAAMTIRTMRSAS